jgi:hypothetical protein
VPHSRAVSTVHQHNMITSAQETGFELLHAANQMQFNTSHAHKLATIPLTDSLHDMCVLPAD